MMRYRGTRCPFNFGSSLLASSPLFVYGLLFLLCPPGLVNAALNIDGTYALQPAVNVNDPSPIADINTYEPDQHDCPTVCTDLSNVHSWITYLSRNRLRRCRKPMLVHLAVSQPLTDSSSHQPLRACTLGQQDVTSRDGLSDTVVENPKLASSIIGSTIDSAPACAVRGIPYNIRLPLFNNESKRGGGNSSVPDVGEISSLLKNVKGFFAHEDNCDESFAFAYHGDTIIGVFIGSGLGKPTISSAIDSLVSTLVSKTYGAVGNETTTELCSGQRSPRRILGIVISTTGDLEAVQQRVLAWSQGECSANSRATSQQKLLENVQAYDIAGVGAGGSNSSWVAYHSRFEHKSQSLRIRSSNITRQDVCSHVQVMPGDGCQSLAAKCGIPAKDLIQMNAARKDLCSNLGDYEFVCCSAGKPYVRSATRLDGIRISVDTCKTHLIKNGDVCAALATRYGVTVANIEKWNKGKTWAWTVCKNMMVEYNMCVGPGTPPLPPPQEGAACGPLVPGTKAPSSDSVSLADLNPCPLKACCSNWGFCGPFPAHCDVNAPKGGGPGTRLPGYESTCVSNCGTEIKKNSGAPSSFQRIGYYESWNLGRNCLWMKVGNANTDGSYTHIHWGFIDIDSTTWKPVVRDPHDQWQYFKQLRNVKRIVSFGGWTYSTEPATYNVIRQAIIDNRDTFATNLAKFASDEDLDGIDIDWEYPGAPDILVGGKPIGQQGDGVAYLKFLTTLKQKIGSSKSVSIAAPASYWYFKAFPIDRIAQVIDYIVYMTYDLHGQWDYGNRNAFDQCDSGKCIRSHVNLTETRTSLSIITKAGVANNKIYVGESSYGRSFHMARNGCWGPLCEFTGSRIKSDAAPGRCTKTGGYLANAEINEIRKRGGDKTTLRDFRDETSDSDIMLYNGDYVSYMTDQTKLSRRKLWKDLNFAGTIDWAVDLQRFGDEDLDNFDSDGDDDDDDDGNARCVSGEDLTTDTGDLCQFACHLGFCPAPLCRCRVKYTKPVQMPDEKDITGVYAWDPFDPTLNRLCRFSCKYNYCPKALCGIPVPAEPETGSDPREPDNSFCYTCAREANANNCQIYENGRQDVGRKQCERRCQSVVDEAKEKGEWANSGCVGYWPLDEEIPWQRSDGTRVAMGQCVCNSPIVNELAETIFDILAEILKMGCLILMSAVKLVVETGLNAFPAGRAVTAGLDAITTAAKTIDYVYDKNNDPAGAFDFWLLPCGGGMLPDEVQQVFDILSTVTGDFSYKTPKILKKGSGKKGDSSNPPYNTRKPPSAKPKPQPKPQPNKGGVSKNKRPKAACKIKGSRVTREGFAKNTLRTYSCSGTTTVATDQVITSLEWVASPKPTATLVPCKAKWNQACFHYSSAISVNTDWSTLKCPKEAMTTARRDDLPMTKVWANQHKGDGWIAKNNGCDKDEFPPAYLLAPGMPAHDFAGQNKEGQLMRYIHYSDNRGAGSMWGSVCFVPHVRKLTDSEFKKNFVSGGAKSDLDEHNIKAEQVHGTYTNVPERVEFSIDFQHAAKLDDGLWDNKCWPKNKAKKDPGFALLTHDPWYANYNRMPQWDYQAKYDPKGNPPNGD